MSALAGVMTLPGRMSTRPSYRRRRSFRDIREDGPLGKQLMQHAKNADSRKMFAIFLLSKVIAIAIIFLLIKVVLMLIGNVAMAQDAAATPPPPGVVVAADDV